MEESNYDIMTVSAYSDSSYARDRELWRGFLGYTLPIVMSMDVGEVEKYLGGAIVYSLSELTASGGANTPVSDNIRSISIQLAKEIGLPPEFGLASFFEGKVPTRLYRMKSKPYITNKSKKEKKEDNMIAEWLSALAKIQGDKKFLRTVERWKSWFLERGEKAS